MKWEARPIEVAHLLNPAFGALLLREAAVEYTKASRTSIPFGLCFLVLPLALHPPTRRALPTTTRSLLPQWLESHPELQALSAERMRRLSPYSREAILFGLQNGLLSLDSEGSVRSAVLQGVEERGVRGCGRRDQPRVAELVRASFDGGAVKVQICLH